MKDYPTLVDEFANAQWKADKLYVKKGRDSKKYRKAELAAGKAYRRMMKAYVRLVG